MTETSRLNSIETILKENRRQIKENGQNIQKIITILRKIKEKMLVIARSTIELRVSTATVIEAQRSTQESVERVSNTVATLATEAAQDRAEIRQIWEYLLRDRGNGQTQ
jgi:ABC-type transporter Mla subunit MlaD